MISRASTSAWVIVYEAVTVHDSPISKRSLQGAASSFNIGSVIVTSVSGVFPTFVATKVYTTVEPAFVPSNS